MATVKKQRAYADGTPLLGPSEARSPFSRRWARRLVSISLFTALFALTWALLPLLLLIGWPIDRLRRKSVIAPASLLFALYFLFELLGVGIALFIWLGTLGGSGRRRHRFLRWNLWLQCWWLRNLFGAGRRLFRFNVEITGEEAVQRGNFLFFIRHVSTADTLLAGVFVSDRHGIALRYVLKESLLWDPCLDIVGNRLPNGFVRRGPDHRKQAVNEVVRLTRSMGPADGVLIYPEGTRFTPGKRARLLSSLEEKGDAQQLQRARSLQHVLPPRLLGPLALLDRASDADVVFCAHTGFEKALSFREFMAGGLGGITLHVGFWRVPRELIPHERLARIEFLHEQWKKVDAWIAERNDAS